MNLSGIPTLTRPRWVLWAGRSKGALEKPRYFRSMVQRSAVWNRYAPAAVAMGQLTWPQALAHLDQMCNWQRRNVIVVIVRQWCSLYDELLRKSVANRAEWMTGVWIANCSVWGTGQGKSWKLLEHAYCKPVWVVIPTRFESQLQAEANDCFAKQQAQREASMNAVSAASQGKGKGKEENKLQAQPTSSC